MLKIIIYIQYINSFLFLSKIRNIICKAYGLELSKYEDINKVLTVENQDNITNSDKIECITRDGILDNLIIHKVETEEVVIDTYDTIIDNNKIKFYEELKALLISLVNDNVKVVGCFILPEISQLFSN